MFENKVRGELSNLDATLEALRAEPALKIFSLNDRQLELAIDVGFRADLNPFDQSVLAAVLGRADDIQAADANAELAFCELDGDLQPWDKQGRRRRELADLYDPRGIWVYGDFDLEAPQRPPDWPPK